MLLTHAVRRSSYLLSLYQTNVLRGSLNVLIPLAENMQASPLSISTDVDADRLSHAELTASIKRSAVSPLAIYS